MITHCWSEETETEPMDLTWQSAMLTRDGKRLTQAATDSILGGVTELFQSRLTAVCDSNTKRGRRRRYHTLYCEECHHKSV